MEKILVICGPTATGKTSLALKLAKKFNGEIVSADSRQVYRKMDIGTGKDISINSKLETHYQDGKSVGSKLGGFYCVNDISIWGYDLADYKKEFSVSLYVKVAKKIIADIQKRGKLPIVVGGTGLYIKALIDGIGSVDIPKNTLLRKKLEDKLPNEIFKILFQIDPVRATALNLSDKKNKRRLIRAIEIAQYSSVNKKINRKVELKDSNNILFLGLTAEMELLKEKIKRRVDQRIKNGFEKEIQNLLKGGFLQSPQAVNTLGYKQWIINNTNKGTMEEFINTWEVAERKYVKRQITWFKKDKRINWFDIKNNEIEKTIEKCIQKWYDGGNETGSPKSRTLV